MEKVKTLEDLLARYREDLNTYEELLASSGGSNFNSDYAYYDGASNAIGVAIALLEEVINGQKE